MLATEKRPLWSGLTRKLLIGFGGVMVILFVVATLLIAFLTSHSHALEAVQHENYDSVRFCEGMKGALDQAQAIAQLNQPLPATAGDALDKARADFETNARAQLRNTTLAGEMERSQQAVTFGKQVFDQTRRWISDSSIHDRPAFYREEIFPPYQQCRNALSDVSQMNLTNLVRVNGQVRSALLAMRTTIILLLIIGLSMSSVFVILTARGMIRPLIQLTSSVRQIEEGNLDPILEAGDNDDEIGELAQAFNKMAVKLREFRRLDLERLARTQQTTQAAIDSLPDGVAVLDIDGRIEISNRTAQIHFHLIPGENIHAVRPDWGRQFLEPVLNTRQSVLPDGYRSAIQLFDETGERFLLPRAVPMFDARETLIGVTLVLVEITHLRKADEFKSGLLSAVSHELKTPLTSVRMAMRMLSDKRIGELNDRQQTLLGAAKVDSERLVRTVEDILTIGRVEAGRARLDLADIAASEVAERALATVESAAAEKRISLLKNWPDPVPIVHVDLNLLACALANLLSNAVKFSPEGSSITSDIRQNDGQIEIAVQDEGPGIPEQYRTRIFEKFFRIPSPDGPAGAGLGLSIASEIVQLHGGNISVITPPPAATCGSRFVIRIPAVHTDAAAR